MYGVMYSSNCSIHVVPMDLDVKMKAVMLGACFLIVSFMLVRVTVYNFLSL